jgi:DNA-binding NarL/FixJ family response regulator
MTNILIADSFYLSRSGLSLILSSQPDFRIVGQTIESDRLYIDIQNYEPDVVVMDILLQPKCPIDIIQEICCNSKIKFLILANEAYDPNIIPLLRAGAHGCIQKDIGEDCLIQAIREVARDKSPISPNIACGLLQYLRNNKEPDTLVMVSDTSLSHRELMVLHLLSEGLPNKIIGRQLDIKERTVEAHVRNILKKLKVTNRTQAAFLASKNGWLSVTN